MSALNDWNIDTLFIALDDSTKYLSKKDRSKVFNGMAHKLLSWNTCALDELMMILRHFEVQFDPRFTNS